MTSAARNRRYRARQRAGAVCWTVPGDDVAVPKLLVDVGVLDAAAVDDRAAIGEAIGRLLETGTRPGVRIVFAVQDGHER